MKKKKEKTILKCPDCLSTNLITNDCIIANDYQCRDCGNMEYKSKFEFHEPDSIPIVISREHPLSEPKHLNEYKLRRANQKDEIEFLLKTLDRSIQTGMNTFGRETNIALIKRIYDKFQEQWTN